MTIEKRAAISAGQYNAWKKRKARLPDESLKYINYLQQKAKSLGISLFDYIDFVVGMSMQTSRKIY
jgi:hypothetical protein